MVFVAGEREWTAQTETNLDMASEKELDDRKKVPVRFSNDGRYRQYAPGFS